MKAVLVACLLCVSVQAGKWGKSGHAGGTVSAVKDGKGDRSTGWKATGRFGKLDMQADGSYHYDVDEKSDLVKHFAKRPNVLVDRFYITTDAGDRELSFDVATIPRDGSGHAQAGGGGAVTNNNNNGAATTTVDPNAGAAGMNNNAGTGTNTGATTTNTGNTGNTNTGTNNGGSGGGLGDLLSGLFGGGGSGATTNSGNSGTGGSSTSSGSGSGGSGPIPGSVPLIDGHYHVGDKGEGVRSVQANLKALGYTIDVDGIYGPQTSGVVSAFQKSVGLQGLGMVGPMTMAKLKEKTGQYVSDANNHGGTVLPHNDLSAAASVNAASTSTSAGPAGPGPSWMTVALAENAKRIIETPGSGSNKEIEKYHTAAGLPGHKDDTPWCGSFITWVMKQAGFTPAKTGARALSWSDAWPEGKKLSGPVYGAVAVKTRTGGGHVGFVVGKIGSAHLAILGGNQGDALTVAKYTKSSFHAYMVPKSYNAPDPSSLAEYTGSFGAAGKEA